MTNNVLWMILASAIGLGTGQSIERSPETTQANLVSRGGCYIDGHWYSPCPKTDCYINGNWYNPCPTDSEPPTDDPGTFDRP